MLLQGLGHREVNGLFSGLPADVGHRGVYLPSLYQIELDEQMYGDVRRPDALRRPTATPTTRSALAPRRGRTRLLRDLGGDRLEAPVRDRLRRLLIDDLQALERVKADIARAIAGGGRYAVMFFPEIGHGPWPRLRPTTPTCWRAGAR